MSYVHRICVPYKMFVIVLYCMNITKRTQRTPVSRITLCLCLFKRHKNATFADTRLFHSHWNVHCLEQYYWHALNTWYLKTYSNWLPFMQWHAFKPCFGSSHPFYIWNRLFLLKFVLWILSFFFGLDKISIDT